MPVLSTMVARAGLACIVIAGGFALWTVVPVGWMYLTGELVSGGGARFVLVLFGCPLTMAGAFVLLSAVEGQRRLLSPASDPLPLLEVTLVASAVIAIVALVGWWALLADSPNPSGPLQPI